MQHQSETHAKRPSLIHNSIYNISYQILILLLPLITTPYVTRTLGPDGVGMYGRTYSISQYFVLFGCIGLNLYGQREVAYHQSDIQGRSKVFFELSVIRLCSMLISIFAFICTVYNNEKYSFLYRIELFELIAALIDVTWFFQGMEEFKKIVIRNSFVRIIGVIGIFIFVKSENDTHIYTAILALSVFFGNITLWFYIPKYVQRVSFKILEIKKHIKPALLLFIPQIATSVYNVLDKSMIGLITNVDAEVAYYEQAQKIIKMALAFPTAVGTVMLPRIASMYGRGDEEGIKQYIHKSMRFICMLTCPLCFGIIGIAKDFVPWFFGDGFEKVYDNFLIIAPIIIIVGISNVLGVQYLLPTNRQKDYTKSVIAGTAVNFLCNMILIPRFLSLGAAAGSIIAETSVTVIQIVILRKEFSIRKIVNNSFKYLIGSIIMLLCVIAYSALWGNCTIVHTFIEICIGALAYVVFLIFLRDSLFYRLVNRFIIFFAWRRK